MIRTKAVKLTVIPAVAYRRKLTSGGAGVVIVRGDVSQPGIAGISKTSGTAVPAAGTPKKQFPDEAFREALELTAGLPYKKLGSVRYDGKKVSEQKDEAQEVTVEDGVAVDSREYNAIVDAYTDKSGKLSYELLNRDLIKFAHSSSVARAMIERREPVEKIRLYVTGTKFRSITKNQKLTDKQVLKMSELLDEVSPKGVYRALNDELRLRLKAAKGK